jgi:glycosyltransferase involved in cell wall biosynthesis
MVAVTYKLAKQTNLGKDRSMTPELITIGMPCYNAAATLRAALKSALAQDWENTEIIVVDDCSTDDSAEIVMEIAEADPRVRLVRHLANTGAGGARKTILEQARGEFIAFFDDDDASEPSRLTIQRQRIASYEVQTGAQLVACFASGERRYPNGYTRGLQAIGSQPKAPVGSQVADYLLFNERVAGIFYGAGTPASAMMARRSVMIAVGGFDDQQRRVEDVDFAIRLALQGGHFVGCPEKLYRQNATTGSDKSAQANFEAEKKLIQKHRVYLEKLGLYSYTWHWFHFRYYHFSKQPIQAALALLKSVWASPLRAAQHLLRSVPRRLVHESRMQAGAQ